MCALTDNCVIKVVGPSLGEQLDALFGKGGFQELSSFNVDDASDLSWDADSTTTLEFGHDRKPPSGMRKLQRQDSCVSVASATPFAFERMADLALEVGEAENGMVVPNTKGICIKLGFEVLIRMCIRTILSMPPDLAVRLCEKYVGKGVQYVSTTFAGSDGIIEPKCARIVAANMLMGHVHHFPDEEIHFRLEQTVASEIDPRRVQFLKGKVRCEFHKINAICKDLSSYVS